MAQSLMQKLPEVNIKKTIPLLDEKVSCPAVGAIPAFEASVSGSVDACMVVNVTLAVTAVGTLVRTLLSPSPIHSHVPFTPDAREFHQIRHRGGSRCGFGGYANFQKLGFGTFPILQEVVAHSHHAGYLGLREDRPF
jgi:hypothetical protein